MSGHRPIAELPGYKQAVERIHMKLREGNMNGDLSKFLADPRPGMTLDELAVELNHLAQIRDNARLAFCKRLAVAYLMLVGHVPQRGRRGSAKFYKWCSDKIRSANGKPYNINTLVGYVQVGFAKNPQKFLAQKMAYTTQRASAARDFAYAVRSAVSSDTPPKVIPITKLKQQGMPTDVAREVNVLMTAWEQASSRARSQFMYMITGKRIAA
jgi:hypothetical protein